MPRSMWLHIVIEHVQFWNDFSSFIGTNIAREPGSVRFDGQREIFTKQFM